MKNFTIPEAIATLENGQWHSVAFVTADMNKKTGGKIIRIKECKISPHNDSQTLALAISSEASANRARKRQNHSINATRNLLLRNGQVRKMHIYTMFNLNQIPVL